MATFHCRACGGDTDDAQPGAGTFDGVPVHLIDTGGAHHEIDVHPVHDGAYFGVPIRQPMRVDPPMLPTQQSLDAAAAIAAAAGVIFWTDVSQWQGRAYDGSYPWPVAAYRASLGTTVVDNYGAANTRYCHAVAGSKLIGHIGYHVWYPGSEAQQAAKFLSLCQVDPFFAAMVDVESWSGSITGDHSQQITALCDALAAQLGNPARVKVYGNSGDLASIAPNVPAKYGRIKAGYSSQSPGEPWDGWQYSDGSTQWSVPAGWSRTSAPFGAADHNAFYGTTAQFQTTFGLTTGDSSMSAAEVADLKAYIDGWMQKIVQAIGEPTHPTAQSLWNHVDNMATILGISLMDGLVNGHIGSPSVFTQKHFDNMGIKAGQGLGQKVDGVASAVIATPTADAIAAAVAGKIPTPTPLSDAQVQALGAEVALEVAQTPPPPYVGTFTPQATQPKPAATEADADAAAPSSPVADSVNPTP